MCVCVCVCVCVYVSVCVEGGVLMAVSCGRMADQGWEVSVSGISGDEVRSDSGQILLDKFLHCLHLLQERKIDVGTAKKFF